MSFAGIATSYISILQICLLILAVISPRSRPFYLYDIVQNIAIGFKNDSFSFDAYVNIFMKFNICLCTFLLLDVM